jgi:triosephosphate isomerase (TIM)
MRKMIVAGNWKMNLTFQEADDLIGDINDLMDENEIDKTLVVVIPPSPYLEMATDLAEGTDLKVGAQNFCSYARFDGSGFLFGWTFRKKEIF